MNRESCLYCVLKHLAQAQDLIIKSHRLSCPLSGLLLSVAHLAQAEAESLEAHYKNLALDIRKVRLAIMGQKGESTAKQGIMKLIEQANNILESLLSENNDNRDYDIVVEMLSESGVSFVNDKIKSGEKL